MNYPDITPLATSSLKNGLFFASSAGEDEFFKTPCVTGDLFDHASMAVTSLISNCAKQGVVKNDLAKLVVYYVEDELITQDELTDFIFQQLSCNYPPVITMVPFSLHHPYQLKLIIEAVGTQSDSLPITIASDSSAFSQAIRHGEIIFVGAINTRECNKTIQQADDIVKQSHLVLKKLDTILDHFRACRKDIVKINNWYVAGGGAEQWSQSAKVRAAYYPEPGPVATGLPVKSLGHKGLYIQTDCWIMIDLQDQSIEKHHSWPAGHWDWPIHLPFKHGLKCRELIFTGGQVSMDSQANVTNRHDIITQSHTSMRNVAAVLKEFDAGLEDIIKMTAFYQSCKEPEDLINNLSIRAEYFRDSRLQSTSIPLDYLAYEDMLTEFEVIAVTG